MKITIEIDTTPKEVREFFGLPDVQPLQDEMLKTIRENMEKSLSGFDAATLMKPNLPAHLQSMETLQKAFWGAFSKSMGGAASGQDEKSKGKKPDK